MAGVVERLHGLLVEAVRGRHGGDPTTEPVTVAEIYQELVPYRGVRAALGLEMNADYEHALLRLLSGESELARLEPPTAREQLREELESPNPNVTLYRRFAACDVWLAAPVVPPDWVTSHLVDDDSAEPFAPEPDGEPRNVLGWSVADLEEVDLPALDVEEPPPPPAAPRPAAPPAPDPAAPAPPAAPAAPERDAAPDAPRAPEPAPAPSAPVANGGTGAARGERAPVAAHCRFCDSELPRSREIRYCPYCGADQTLRPCPACGEVVEAGWAFCIACGTPADAGA